MAARKSRSISAAEGWWYWSRLRGVINIDGSIDREKRRVRAGIANTPPSARSGCFRLGEAIGGRLGEVVVQIRLATNRSPHMTARPIVHVRRGVTHRATKPVEDRAVAQAL